MRCIRWAPAAADDLEGIRDYLREHHRSFTQPTIRRLYDAARSLKQMPHRGRVGHRAGTRELVLAPLPYIIVYGVEPEIVQILRVLHSSENRD